MDPAFPLAEAIAISNGHILDVGSMKKMRRFMGPQTQVVDVNGNTILPGFIDCHVHFMQMGLDMMKLDLGSCPHITAVMDIIAEKVKTSRKGEWILGSGYNELQWPQKRMLTLKELDACSSHHPIWLCRKDQHSSVVNTRAFQALNIPPDLRGVERDEEGERTGILFGEANSFVKNTVNRLLDSSTKKKRLEEAAQKLISYGITTVHALEGGEPFGDGEVDLLLSEKDSLPLDVKVYFQTKDIKKVVERGLQSIGGCILVDGSLGSKTAALHEPYSDDAKTSGLLYHDSKQLEDFILMAHQEGLQIAVHAIGDQAIEQILTAYEKALSSNPRPDHRHRIEHFSLPTPQQIRRCAALGVMISLQPSWFGENSLTGIVGPKRLGERVGRLYPLASLLQAGISLCGGSDSPIVSPDPLLGIGGGMNHFRKEERLPPLFVAALYTTGAARAGFEEQKKGMIRPGYQADLICLDGDLLSANPSSLAVKKTLVKGQVVFEREEE